MKQYFFALLAVSLGASSALAQVCSGNGDFQGPYMVLASRGIATPAPAPPNLPPGITQPAPRIQYSKTSVGRLLEQASANGAFALTLRIFGNGQGELWTALPDSSITNVRIGSYTVNADCTMAFTIADGFAAELDSVGLPAVRGSASFQGVLTDRGNEANFTQTSQGSGTTLRIERAHTAAACTNNLLNGVFGVFATGLDLGSADAPNEVPFTMVGRFAAENGEFFIDNVAQASPQPKRQITGAYKVESDCTGTARFIQDGKTLNVSFVLTRGGVTFGIYSRPTMTFAFTDGRIVGSGEAR